MAEYSIITLAEYSFEVMFVAMDKSERIKIFCGRLQAAPFAATDEEALAQIAAILNAVEDEFTDVPYDPPAWETDGRMYPPQADFEFPDRWPELRRFRSKGHHILVSGTGAIELQGFTRQIVFSKKGIDGKTVDDWRDK